MKKGKAAKNLKAPGQVSVRKGSLLPAIGADGYELIKVKSRVGTDLCLLHQCSECYPIYRK